MSHLNYCDFSKLACSAILDYLPDSYKDASVSVFRNVKLGEEYDAMTVRQKSGVQARAVNLNDFYSRYCMGDDMDSLLKKMADIVEQGNLNCDTSWITDYSEARNHLFMRLSNALWNEKVMKQAPCIRIEDLALTFHIMIDMPDDHRATALINNHLMEIYGVTKEQLYEDAVKSSQLIQPASFGVFRSSEFLQHPCCEPSDLYVLTSQSGYYGASVLFYPGILQEAAEAVGGDYFILPSSIHEVYLLKDSGQESEKLDEIVREANREVVESFERLSDHVYHYDAGYDLFESGDRYKARKAGILVC